MIASKISAVMILLTICKFSAMNPLGNVGNGCRKLPGREEEAAEAAEAAEVGLHDTSPNDRLAAGLQLSLCTELR